MTHHFGREAMKPEYILPELLERLTPREKQVLDIILEAKTAKEIAFDLGISQRTVEAHTERLRIKLLARSITDILRIVAAAERMGLVRHDQFVTPVPHRAGRVGLQVAAN
ncbi:MULTISPECIES: LuxR C-terminal-related transcriptional regulator [Devosia]|uniref:Transcriptional regulatory protein TdiR n=1 Tax=Devosia equisanguinis TaxID=2490941 RepID=A0A3S4CCX3_9HYPH|nr:MULTISPECIES: LuxR C-terminal-related transcriptional regulator [Devosia]ODT48242.1 MAG: hypothetical protein ABS74_18950 [Pelagibacterium sp. SCN 63-126]ODU84284.1 MAG: hypothetical protein ABT14_14670 [Pelagibacterium sp. SCN 63-17]OJX42046.1 MAG: hypothetical protein BGO80_10895 [Devosia sp. 63-57]VDS05275.1 Transcriptional regulatory protein TdiR [Devosia equisanguinis]